MTNASIALSTLGDSALSIPIEKRDTIYSFEKNLFENSLMPHLTQQLLLPFLLHVHKPFLYMQPLFFLEKVAQVRQQEEEEESANHA